MFKLENYTRSVSGRTVALNLTNCHTEKWEQQKKYVRQQLSNKETGEIYENVKLM
jgi:hypothetical protein